ncbi:hypothetical protein BKG91_09015 [Rodentibacter caecimuris]|uniref:DUF2335 domain-containing protein n=1 Tax=Rodentibacter caecimuris TaxID=1796644 RepID=A0AAJ3K6D0_9PAST|nr:MULTISPECIES: hypothetical protein [Pasteurellaceae]AOF54490.1 hypothetical protein AC062_2404 [Pasteurellaceae bacterium NI1060]MCQ9122734.1 hypothetical protein [Rodentibacter heylii]MCR1838508.1 hypothetical protein [Pasteurella caecimuris]MCU0108128.1 hypothetical protein [Pasteurella caecimuris]OOF72588.1 hypothetical protein BKG90_03795 [Rodentibacter heylii]
MKNEQEQENLPSEMLEEEHFMKEFVHLQQQEIMLKREELALRREEIQANERLAERSIEAKQQTDLNHGNIFSALQKGKLYIIALIAVLVMIIILYAMNTGNTEFALEVLKIGGALTAGYFAGFGKGKSVVLEQQQRRNEDE